MADREASARRSGWRCCIAAVLLVSLLVGCGVHRGAGAAAALGEPVDVPDGWHTVTVCAAHGEAVTHVPGRMAIEGPRELRNIAPPATGMFLWGYNADRSIRYDVLSINDAAPPSQTVSDEDVARQVVKALNGSPADVRIRNLERRVDRVIGTYDERFDGRIYRMRFVAKHGAVVVVGVGIFPGSSRDTVEEARVHLDVMWQNLSVAGVGDTPSGPCAGPSDEPG